jgi:hypothetical protein
MFNSVYANTFGRSTNRLVQITGGNYWRRYFKLKQEADTSTNFEENYVTTICGASVRNVVDFTSVIGAGGESLAKEADGTCANPYCTQNKFNTGGMGFYVNSVTGVCEYRVVLGYLFELPGVENPTFNNHYSWPIDNWSQLKYTGTTVNFVKV